MSKAATLSWEEFKKKREGQKVASGETPKPQALTPESIEWMKKGDQVATTFGRAHAQLICVERFDEPTLFLRFLVMVFGCEVAEVCAEKDQQGKWTMEEL